MIEKPSKMNLEVLTRTGGPDSSANHNKIESPGKKYRE